ncbi:hypothetical protein PGT21_037094 [Puccinia graminis f. sp. tritici]|uniref:Uncharacterized protein n=1 Tax=Puccinia graminis f. sp. tritici TaxID=56615 RepID=A0A5B0QRN9_PUCGR|nr:hypothetical protein PGT21_037094 [Puccinia graminis f. sp. tritici]
MPAPNLIRLPLPFDQLTNRTLDVHGWVVVLNITPNMEVMPANERNPDSALSIWVTGYGFVVIPSTRINMASLSPL